MTTRNIPSPRAATITTLGAAIMIMIELVAVVLRVVVTAGVLVVGQGFSCSIPRLSQDSSEAFGAVVTALCGNKKSSVNKVNRLRFRDLNQLANKPQN